jgi:hypothetical protein
MLVAIGVFAVAVFMFLPVSLAYGRVGWEQRDQILADVGGSTEGATRGGWEGIREDFATSFERNIAVATGQNIEGDVDEQSAPAGIELLPPFMGEQDQRLTMSELPYLSINARVRGTSPVDDITVTTVCHVQPESEAREYWTAETRSDTGGFRQQAGEEQPVRPASVSGTRFEKAVTCRPSGLSCDRYLATMTSQADGIVTNARLTNYFISMDALEEALLGDAEYNRHLYEGRIPAEMVRQATISRLFPETSGDAPVSISSQAPIMALISTMNEPLIGLATEEEENEFLIYTGFENLQSGWVATIEEVELDMPEDFAPVEDFCEGWTQEDNKLTLNPETYSGNVLLRVTRGMQKTFPPCLITNIAAGAYSSPVQKRFFLKIDYSYKVQEEYELDIRPDDGGRCSDEEEETEVSSSDTDDESDDETDDSTDEESTDE